MNCCNHNSNDTNENNQKSQHTHKGGHLFHMLMMALCCGAPVLILLAVPLLGSSLPGLRAVLLGIAPFLCPLMMIPMMLRHGKHDDHCEGEKQREKDETLDVPKSDRFN